jgi:magnesium-transporting ATPase (P-type)
VLTNCKSVGGQQVCQSLSAAQQLEIYYAAQAAWYISLVCSQFWHIWVCKTRSESIFKHGIFRNMVTVYGVLISCTVMVIIVYVPFLQGIFSTAFLPGVGWLPMIGTLLWLLPFSEYTKRQVRHNPDGWWAKYIAW